MFIKNRIVPDYASMLEHRLSGCFNDAGGGTGGAGGGSPGAGTGDLSEAAQNQVAEIVNRAITARNKMFEKKWSDDAEKLAKGIKNQITEALAGLAPGGEGGEGGKKTKKGDGDGANDPQIASLKKQLDDLKTETEKAKQERDDERGKTRSITLRQKVTDELGKHGITGPHAVIAVGHLIDSRKVVRFDDEGQSILFKDETNDTDLDLATGVKTWAKSDEAKLFTPARGAHGSGSRGGGAPPGGDGKPPPLGDILTDFLSER